MDTMKRRLTSSEAEFLYPIFRSTLPYRRIVCDINSGNVGGQRNSITPTGNPFFSVHVYCNDFAADSVPFDSKWVFVHELTHVWQYYHQVNLVFSAIGLFVSNIKCGYGAAYPYDLKSSKDLSGFNIEQQASIVADYWAMTQGLKPGYNSDPQPRLTDYVPYIDQLRRSGPPHTPSLHDYDGVFESHA